MPRAKKARGFFHVRPGKRAQVIITAAVPQVVATTVVTNSGG